MKKLPDNQQQISNEKEPGPWGRAPAHFSRLSDGVGLILEADVRSRAKNNQSL